MLILSHFFMDRNQSRLTDDTQKIGHTDSDGQRQF